jgi:hypothetical protein
MALQVLSVQRSGRRKHHDVRLLARHTQQDMLRCSPDHSCCPCTTCGHAQSRRIRAIFSPRVRAQRSMQPNYSASRGRRHARLSSAFTSSVKRWFGVPPQAAGTFTSTTPGRPHARGATSWTRASWQRAPSPPARPAPSAHPRAGGCARGALCSPQRPVRCISGMSSVRGVYIVWLRPLHSRAVSMSQGRMRVQTSLQHLVPLLLQSQPAAVGTACRSSKLKCSAHCWGQAHLDCWGPAHLDR